VNTENPVCYKTADQGAWCFFLIKNNLDEPLENVSARLYIVPTNGAGIVEKTAFTPLNLIQPESAMPVMAFFEPSLDQEFSAGAELISALPASRANERYLAAHLQIDQVIIGRTGLEAKLEGDISIPEHDAPAVLLRLAAIAYGADGQVVGVKQAELDSSAETGKNLPFSLTVFSLGPPIDRVEAYVEAIPQVGISEETPAGN
jgi:hypothetical protein